MKILKSTLLAALAVASVTVASALTIPSTGQVKLTNTPYDGGPNPGFQGGEFGATIIGTGDTFYTFCMERNEGILTGQVYNYELSNATDYENPDDVLSKGSAYLYTKFVKGQLYTRLQDGDTGLHDLWAGYLQIALWYLEDEDFSDFSAGGVAFWITNNPFLNDAIGVFGAAVKDDYTEGKVAIMNIFDLSGNPLQSQIVYVPDSGTTLALLGLALAGFAVIRRRR